jgi:deazaflavin-dependent oxidoreductase (nitroreductase family)
MSDVNDWNAKVIEEFRANGGRMVVDSNDVPMLLLHTRGAKTGEDRVNPVMYLDDNGLLFVFASKGGADSNPDWYYNLTAHPEVIVELGTDTFAATAIVVKGEERDRIWDLMAQGMPQFGEYQTKTARVIPVIELRRFTNPL